MDSIEDIGLYLKQLREERKISVAQVAQALKAKTETILELEANDFGKLPAPAYVKGYLRSYANFLGIESEPVLMEYNKKYPQTQKQVFTLQNQQLPRVGINIGTIIKSKIFIPIITIIIILSLSITLLVYFLVRKHSLKQAGQKITIEKTEKIQKITDPGKTETHPQTIFPLTTPITLSARALDNVWVRISSDNKIIFEGILKKNEIESWQANEEFRLRIGNPTKLNITLNGKPVGPLSPPYGTINAVINTKEIKVTQ